MKITLKKKELIIDKKKNIRNNVPNILYIQKRKDLNE
jgi:hypothetical protein